MKINIYDFLEVIDSHTEDANGFCVAYGVLARSGIQQYKGSELGGSDFGFSPDKVYNIYRPIEEVEKSIPSLRLLPVTQEHPPVLLDGISYSKYAKGTSSCNIEMELAGDTAVVRDVGGIRIWDTRLSTLITNSIKNGGGMHGISVGYKASVEIEEGIYGNTKYQAVYRNILGNHIAVCARPRGGELCRLKNITTDIP